MGSFLIIVRHMEQFQEVMQAKHREFRSCGRVGEQRGEEQWNQGRSSHQQWKCEKGWRCFPGVTAGQVEMVSPVTGTDLSFRK